MVCRLMTTLVAHGRSLHHMISGTLSGPINSIVAITSIQICLFRRWLVSNREPFAPAVVQEVIVDMQAYLSGNHQKMHVDFFIWTFKGTKYCNLQVVSQISWCN